MPDPVAELFGCNACKGTYVEFQPDGTIYHHACAPLPPDKDGVQAERPDKRDENLAYGRRERVIGIRSEGAGVTCLSAAQIVEPHWLTALKRQIEKEENS